MTRRDFEALLILKAWKDDSFRRALLGNPKSVFEKEAGLKLPEETEVRVLEETAGVLYVVLPAAPDVEGGLCLTYPEAGSVSSVNQGRTPVKNTDVSPN